MPTKSIRVRILGRDYPLIVREEDEAITREMASYVDSKMQTFKQAHPEQSDLVTAIITALALTEEVYKLRETENNALEHLDTELDALDRQLAQALGAGIQSSPAGDGADVEV
ncbi:MAG TPA: cell division protein ZapA [Rhodothermales bacterium]|nr:cell division protein ZapA [Rhodothermales bacterium]